MGSVEVRFGRGDKRRTLGWLVVGPDGWLKYEQALTLEMVMDRIYQWISGPIHD